MAPVCDELPSLLLSNLQNKKSGPTHQFCYTPLLEHIKASKV